MTSTFTGKFKVKAKSKAYTRKTNKAESMHFHSIMDCLKFLEVPIEPRNEIFKETVSNFATSLVSDGNGAYREYFSRPPHELVYRIVKKT